MAYEVFKRTNVRVETPVMSIIPEGRIWLNSAAARLLVEAGVKTVLLLWDEPNKKLAIQATHKGDKNGYSVSLPANSHAGSIRAKSFLNHIGWSALRRETIAATWNAAEKMLEVSLPAKHLGVRVRAKENFGGTET